MKNRQQMELQQGIHSFMDAKMDSKAHKGFKLRAAWEKVAPERILAHTDNIVFKKNEKKNKQNEMEILVFLDENAWAAECDMSRESYRVLLERELGITLECVRFYVSQRNKYAPKVFKKKTPEVLHYIDQTPSVALQESEEKDLWDKVSSIQNNKLKESLFKAMKADLEWKKGKR